METIIAAALSAITSIIACLINNNIQRTKDQNQIELQLLQTKADLEKSVAVVNVSVKNIVDRMDNYNNIVERMYTQEMLTKSLDERLDKLEQKVG